MSLLSSELGENAVLDFMMRLPLTEPHEEVTVAAAQVLVSTNALIASFESMLDDRPARVEVHRAYQQIMGRRQPDRDLVGEYRKMLESSPDDPALLYLYGRTLDDGRESIKVFERAAASDPPSVRAVSALAYAELALARFESALAHAQQAVQLDPKNANLIWNQGGNNYRLRRYGIARAQYEVALDIDARSDAGGRLTELQLFSEGDSAAARRTVEVGEGFAVTGSLESGEFWLAYMARDYPAALEIARSMRGEMAGVARASGSQRFHSRPLRLATVYRLAGDEASARAWADSALVQAEAALETRPAPEPRDKFGVVSVVHSHIGLALALRGGPGDVDRGIEHAERALRLHNYELDAADAAVGNWFLLRTYVVAGRTDDAIGQIEVMLSQPSFFGLGDLKLDPLYDELREDPRWEELVRLAEAQIEW